jgi:hypothetical protein
MGWIARIRNRLNSRPDKPSGLLGRLRRDEKGATLAMIAAVTIPLIGMVGGAVDMSRAYLVKVRLQQACDAGVLAARRTMKGASIEDAKEALPGGAVDQGKNFFNINLAQGAYGATNITFAMKDAPDSNGKVVGIIHGDATANVPTTLMKVFGQPAIAMTAQCESQLNVTNNDVMFVLDVTGSMACLPSDATSTCDNYAALNTVQLASGRYATTEKTGSRIDGLRQAVKDFFGTLKAATSSTARLRVGFVPYSSGVNVGQVLRDGPAGALATTASYDSRVATFNTAIHTPSTGAWSAWGSPQTYGSAITSANCDKYAANTAFGTFAPNPSGNPAPAVPTAVVSGVGVAKPANVVSTEYRKKSWTATSGGNGTCIRESRTATTTYNTRYGFTNWIYKGGVSYTVSAMYGTAGSTGGVPNPLGSITFINPTTGTLPSANTTGLTSQDLLTTTGAQGFSNYPAQTWDGCIEERGLGSYMDVDTAPGAAANTKWQPTLPGMMYVRTGTSATSTQTSTTPPPADGSSPNYRADRYYIDLATGAARPSYSCPKAATRLAILDQVAVDGYVDAADFVAHGQTYHDIGMLWGVRLMSTTGMFSADHGPAPNGKAVNRHIIFMTDGDMKPSTDAYSTYAVERLNHRIMPTGTDLTAAHNARFLSLCAAADAKGITVWVVSFANGITPELKTCAKDDNHWFEADDTDSLNKAFQSIAQRIAELRLSK